MGRLMSQYFLFDISRSSCEQVGAMLMAALQLAPWVGIGADDVLSPPAHANAQPSGTAAHLDQIRSLETPTT